MLGKTAKEISQSCPPGRNERSDYFNIWWASHQMCYKGADASFLRREYDDWTLKEYLTDCNTIWSNPRNQNESITVRQNGGLYFSYSEDK